MSQVVFILGAGASREAGAPLMGDFLDRAEMLMARGQVSKYGEHFERVFKAIRHLRPVNHNSYLDLNNLESVFAAFEMSRLLGGIPGVSETDIGMLPTSMRWVIWTTLERTVSFPVAGGPQQRWLESPVPYGRFVQLVRRVHDAPQTMCSIITFNYDLALDYALHREGLHTDYSLGTGPPGIAVPLLKLHGSLNWGRCQCGEIIPWDISGFFSEFHPRQLVLRERQHTTLDLPSQISRSALKHCENRDIDPEPFIVPPTWNKTQHHEIIGKVWQRAALELMNAEYVFVSGYSLPDSDLFFRYLFALGTLGAARIKRFWVFEPYDEGVGERFSKIVGRGIEDRFDVKRETFANAIDLMRNELEIEGII